MIWSKQDQGGLGVVQGHRQAHGAGCWTRSIQDHCGPLKNFFLMKTHLGPKTVQHNSHFRSIEEQ